MIATYPSDVPTGLGPVREPDPAKPASHGPTVRRALGGMVAAALTGAIWFGLSDVDPSIRVSLAMFALALVGWTMTRLDETYVALTAAGGLVLFRAVEPSHLFSSFGNDLIWLMFAAFIAAAAVRKCGLAERLSLAIGARARTVRGLFYALTVFIVATAFVVPSTSGRAVLLLPVFLTLSRTIDDARISKALALLFPTAILLSACASLLGAGAHLVTADIVWHLSQQRLGFLHWMMLGLPFALVSCLLSTWVILRCFLSEHERARPLSLAGVANPTALSGHERYVLAVIAAMVLLWLTESINRLDDTLVALLGALALTLPRVGPISLKQGLKEVEWSLLLFMAATLALGASLTSTGAADRLLKALLGGIEGSGLANVHAFVPLIALVSLLAHLVITSRTARATVLVPIVGLVALSFGFNAAAFAFLCVVATGFCQTLTVSAKPVAVFSRVEVTTYQVPDLVRLSALLLPVHFVLLLVFAFLVWPYLGLPLLAK